MLTSVSILWSNALNAELRRSWNYKLMFPRIDLLENSKHESDGQVNISTLEVTYYNTSLTLCSCDNVIATSAQLLF